MWSWKGAIPAVLSCGLIAFGCYLAKLSLTYPGIPWDHGVYLYIGGLIPDGGVPYRDGMDTKNPGIFFLYGAVKYFFGPGLGPVRAFDVAWQILTSLVTGMIALRLLGSKVGAGFACGTYLTLYFSRPWGSLAQPDGFLVLPITILTLCLLRPQARNAAWSWFLAGICMAVAMLLKITAAAYGVMLLLFLVLDRPLTRRYTVNSSWHDAIGLDSADDCRSRVFSGKTRLG